MNYVNVSPCLRIEFNVESCSTLLLCSFLKYCLVSMKMADRSKHVGVFKQIIYVFKYKACLFSYIFQFMWGYLC